jgi:hypothetical protein
MAYITCAEPFLTFLERGSIVFDSGIARNGVGPLRMRIDCWS